LIKEGFFCDEEEVLRHADRMLALHSDPSSAALRKALAAGDDVLDPGLREAEMMNWIELLLAKEDS